MSVTLIIFWMCWCYSYDFNDYFLHLFLTVFRFFISFYCYTSDYVFKKKNLKTSTFYIDLTFWVIFRSCRLKQLYLYISCIHHCLINFKNSTDESVKPQIPDTEKDRLQRSTIM